MLIFLLIPFLFSACNKHSSSGSYSSNEITASINQINDLYVKIKLTNSNLLPTGNISYTVSGNAGFSVYLNGSPSGVCNPSNCPKACEDNAPILGNVSCFIYIHALNILPDTGDLNVINNAANQTITFNLNKLDRLYTAGDFKNAASQQYVAKFNGTSWSELPQPTTPFNGYIYAIKFDSSGNIYAAGDFRNASDQQYVAKFNGTSWSELPQPTTSFNSYIVALNVDSSGNLYTAGNFKNTSGHKYVAKFDGTSWSELPQPPTHFSNFTSLLKTLEFSKILSVIKN